MSSWMQVMVLSLLATFLLITVSSRVADGAVVPDDPKAQEPKGDARRVFMPESDASNFFKRRSRRSTRWHDEYLAEQRVRMQADERRREYNEEQRNEFENYVEEERDEQHERTREKHEQVREYHYDGQYPRYFWSH